MLNIHAGGSQAARAVAGSVVGCMLLLLLTVSSVTICIIILKRKGFTLSTNSNSKASMGKQEANFVTDDNRSKSVRAEVLHASNNVALEVVYDNLDLRSTDSMEENMAYGNADLQSTDSMEENMAYESFTMDEISLRSNTAYYKSGGVLREESDCDISNQYEYISSSYS